MNYFKRVYIYLLISLISFLFSYIPAQTAPPELNLSMSGSTSVDAGNPSSYTYTLTITNNHPTDTATNVVPSIVLPTNVNYISTLSFQKNSNPVVYNFNQTGQTLTWTPTTPMSLSPGDTSTITFNIKYSCNAITSNLQANVSYIDALFLPDTRTLNYNVTVNKGVLSLEKTPSVQSASVGDTVSWTVKVKNTGLGTIYNVNITDNVGSGLTNIIVTPDSTPPNLNLSGSNITTTYSSIAPGSERTFTVQAVVDSCTNLENSVSGTWPSGGPECNNAVANASIALVPKDPGVTYTINGSSPPNNININWTTGSTITVAFSNPGTGPARNFKFQTNLNTQPLNVSSVSSGWTYNSSTGLFTYTGGSPSGSIPPSGNVNLTFNLSPQNNCATTGPNGTITWNPDYTDACGNQFKPPVGFTTYNTINKPTISITKTASQSLVYLGNSFSFNSTLTLSNPSQVSGNVTVTDSVPSQFTINSVNVSAGSTSISGQNITWTVPANLANGSTITINVTATNDACFANNSYTNTINATAITTPHSCTLNTSASASVFLQSFTDNTVTQNKSIDNPPPPFEACSTGNIRYLNSYSFGSGVVGTFTGSTLTEYLPNNQTYVSGSAEYDIDNGSGFSGTYTPIPNGSITSTSPQLVINLGFLQSVFGNNNVANKGIRIRYQLYNSQTGQFIDSTELFINGNTSACSSNNGRYYQAVQVNVQESTVNTSIDTSGKQIVDDCEIFPVTLNVTKNSFTIRNPLTITFEQSNYDFLGKRNGVAPNYTYNSNTYDSISGFNGILPTISNSGSNKLISFGNNDINQGGSITFYVRKKCNSSSSIMNITTSWKNLCGSTLTSNTSYSPVLSRKANLFISATPSAVYTTTQNLSWYIYVTNSGNGTAYNIDIFNSIGSNLRFLNDIGSNLPSGSSFTLQPTPNTNGGGSPLKWTIDKIDPAKTVTIKVNALLIGLCGTNNESSIYGSWGCGISSCQSITPINRPNITIPVSSAVASLIQLTDVPLCGTGKAKMQIKNSGQTHIYNLVNDITLPNGLCYQSGTGLIRINNGSPISFEPSTISGGILRWSFGTSTPNSNLNDINIGDTIELEFDVKAECQGVTNNTISAITYFAKPCEIEALGGIGTGSTGSSTSNNSNLGLSIRQPNVSLSISPSSTSSEPTNLLTWNILATNSSNFVDAKNVNLTVTLPSNLTYNSSATSPTPTNVVGQTVTWSLSDILKNSGTQSVTLGANINSNGCTATPTTLNANITWGCPTGSTCSGTSCNLGSASASPTINTKPQLSNLIVSPNSIDPCGSSSNFFITFTNSGPTAYNVTVSDNLPNGLFFDSSFTPIITGGSYVLNTSPTDGSDPAVWNFTSLGTGTFTIQFKVKGRTTGACLGAGTYNNVVTISHDDHPSCTSTPTYNDLSGTNPVTVTVPSISLAPSRSYYMYIKNATPTPPVANQNTGAIQNGSSLTLEVSFRNSGTAPITSLSINANIGSSYTISSASNSTNGETPSITGNNVIWSITPSSPIVPNQTWTASIVINHISDDVSGLNSTISIGGGCTTGCSISGLTRSGKVFVSLLEQFSKTMNKTIATIGEDVSITITTQFSAPGTGLYTSIRLTDAFPRNGSIPRMLPQSYTISLFDPNTNTTVNDTANWTYTAPSSGNNFVGTWLRTGGGGLVTPRHIILNINAYVVNAQVNSTYPATPNVFFPGSSTNPTRGNKLTNSSTLRYVFGGITYNRSSIAPNITVREPRLKRSKTRVTIPANEGNTSLNPPVAVPTTPTISATTTVVGANEIIGYQLTITNDNNTNCSTAYDIKIFEQIPAGMRANTPVLTSVKLNGVIVPTSQINSVYNSSTGHWNLRFLSSNGFPGIPKNQSLVIRYYCTVDSNVSGNMTMTNTIYLADNTTGNNTSTAGYTSLPLTHPNSSLARYYSDISITPSTHQRTVKTPSLGILKALITNVNETGNSQNTQATPGETITYRVVFGTSNLNPSNLTIFPTGYGTKNGVGNNNTSNKLINLQAPTTQSVNIPNTINPVPTFIDIISDALEVDTSASSISVVKGELASPNPSTDVAPQLLFANDTPSAGFTTVYTNNFSVGPNTVVIVNIVTKLRKNYASNNSNILSGDTIYNGGAGSSSPPDDKRFTRIRFARSGDTEMELNTVTPNTFTVVEPLFPSITKTKVSPSGTSFSTGQTITYRLQTTNNNSSNTSIARNVVITDFLPEGLRGAPITFISETPSATSKSYNPGTGTITWVFSQINPSQTITIDYSAVITSCGNLTNDAKISSYTNLADGINDVGRKIYSTVTAIPVTITVPGLSLQPNHNLIGIPGSTVILPHVINPCNSGSVNLSYTSSKGWLYTIHEDLSLAHDGSLLSPPITSISLTAGTPKYLALKVEIPGNTPNSTVDSVILKATEISGGNTYEFEVLDTITVTFTGSSGQLKLTKSVDKINAKPGDIVTYNIKYQNIGTEELKNIKIQDITPANTTFVSASFVIGSGTITSPSIGGTGNIIWEVSGTLSPGNSGEVSFSVMIK